MKESKQLEYKLDISNTFLKTVSAFANYSGGKIVFGISDYGDVVGLNNPTQACLDIENKINDTIHPQPNYQLLIGEPGNTVTLIVEAGRNTPYTYKSKAYKRNDTATIEVDDLEFNRLVLQGKNINFEDLKADSQDLTFETFSKQAKKEIGIETINKDILKTFNLFSDKEGFNHAAELLADKNNFPGIDVARLGESINVILKRSNIENESIITELKKTVEIYRDYYQYEEIQGMDRKMVETVPEEAFRETIANALIHRTWDINANIRVLMFEDRIEVTSPGGLPPGISENEYLKGNISILRNPILGNVFYRLHLVEILGTGILRIKEAYKNSVKKPSFDISENSITVTLPVVLNINLSKEEEFVYNALSKARPKSISEITNEVPFSKSKTTVLLKNMADKMYISIIGNGRGTKYKL